MTSEVGSGQVAIFPVFKGFRRAVVHEVEGTEKAASTGFRAAFTRSSTAAGRSAGRGFKKAFTDESASTTAAVTRQLNTAVATASRALSAARLKDQDAAGKVRVAEAGLSAARKKGAADSVRVIAAEEKLATAQRTLAVAQGVTKTSTDALRAAQARLAGGVEQTNARQTRSFKTLFSSVAAGAGSVRLFSRFGRTAGIGFGTSFRSAIAPLVGTALALVSVRKLTNFIKESIDAVGNWGTINAQTRATVVSTGRAANVTSKYVHKLSEELEAQTSTQAESIQKGANLLLTFKNIRDEVGKGNNIFTRATGTLVDMARALGKDPKTAAIQLGKALNDPVKGITALSKAGVSFTQQQKDQIKALVASGDLLSAQKIILGELNSEFGGSGAAFMKTYEGRLYALKDAAGDVGETVGRGLMPAIKHFARIATDSLRELNESAFLQAFVTRLSTAATTVTDKGAEVLDMFKQLAGSSSGITFAGVSDGLEGIFPKLAPVLNVLEKLAPIFPSLGQLAQSVAPVLANLLANVVPELADSLVELVPSFGDLLIALLPLIPPLTDLLLTIIPPLADLLKYVLVPALIIVTENWDALITNVRNLVGLLRGDTSLSQFAKRAQGLAGPLGDLMTKAYLFGNAIGNLAANIHRGVDNLFAFQQAVSKALAPINPAFGVLDQFGNAVAGLFGGKTASKVSTGSKVVKRAFDIVDDGARKARAALAATDAQRYSIHLDGSKAVKNSLDVAKAALAAATAARAAADPSDRGVYGVALRAIRTQISTLQGLSGANSGVADSYGAATGAANSNTDATDANTKAKAKAKKAADALKAAQQSLSDVMATASSWLVPSTDTPGSATIDAIKASFSAGGISRAVARALLAATNATNKLLSANIAARDVVTAKLEAANQKLSDALSLRGTYKTTVADAVRAFGDIGKAVADVEQTVVEKIGNALVTSTRTVSAGVQGMIANLRDSVTKTLAFQKTIGALKALGLDDISYKQLVDEFVSSGSTANADALLAGGSTAVAQVATLQGELVAAGESLGEATSKALYQAGVDSAHQLVEGLQRDQQSLIDTGNLLADVLISTISSRLQAASFSLNGGTGIAPLLKSATKSASKKAGSAVAATFKLYDSDGVLLGSMRGQAVSVFGDASISGGARL